MGKQSIATLTTVSIKGKNTTTRHPGEPSVSLSAKQQPILIPHHGRPMSEADSLPSIPPTQPRPRITMVESLKSVPSIPSINKRKKMSPSQSIVSTEEKMSHPNSFQSPKTIKNVSFQSPPNNKTFFPIQSTPLFVPHKIVSKNERK